VLYKKIEMETNYNYTDIFTATFVGDYDEYGGYDDNSIPVTINVRVPGRPIAHVPHDCVYNVRVWHGYSHVRQCFEHIECTGLCVKPCIYKGLYGDELSAMVWNTDFICEFSILDTIDIDKSFVDKLKKYVYPCRDNIVY
jgi:hypothetical protein